VNPHNETHRPVERKLVALFLVVTELTIYSSAFAQSSVTLSGLIDVEINSQVLESNGQRVTNLNGAPNGPNSGLQNSYFQIAGDESVAEGISTGYTLCSYFQPSTGELGRFVGDTIFSCSANLHVTSDFGTLTIGVQESPLYQAMVLFDPFNGSFGYSPIIQQTYYAFAAGNVLSTDTGYSNAISYSLSAINGLSANLLYSLSGENHADGSFSGNIIANQERLSVSFAIEGSTVTGPSNNTFILGGKYPIGTIQKVWLGGTSYDFDPVKAFLSYQREVTTIPGVVAVVRSTAQLGAAATINHSQLLASFAQTTGPIGHRTWSIGYARNLSKVTEVYVAYLHDSARSFVRPICSAGIGVVYRF